MRGQVLQHHSFRKRKCPQSCAVIVEQGRSIVDQGRPTHIQLRDRRVTNIHALRCSRDHLIGRSWPCPCHRSNNLCLVLDMRGAWNRGRCFSGVQQAFFMLEIMPYCGRLNKPLSQKIIVIVECLKRRGSILYVTE